MCKCANESVERKGLVLGQCAFIAVFWVVWGERNKSVFDNVKGDELEQLWDRFDFGHHCGHLLHHLLGRLTFDLCIWIGTLQSCSLDGVVCFL